MELAEEASIKKLVDAKEHKKNAKTKGADRIQQVKDRLEREAQERIATQTATLLATKAEEEVSCSGIGEIMPS